MEQELEAQFRSRGLTPQLPEFFDRYFSLKLLGAFFVLDLAMLEECINH